MNDLKQLAEDLTRSCAEARMKLRLTKGGRFLWERYFPWFFLADVLIWPLIIGAIVWWVTR